MAGSGYRRKSGSVPAHDENAVVSGHRADPACGYHRAPKLAPSLARSAEPPIGDHGATGVGMSQIKLAT
jgi:hypothetical protein